MRRRSSIKLDDKEYTVKELTVREIIDLFSNQQFLSGGSTESKGKGKKKVEEKTKNAGAILDAEFFGFGPLFNAVLKVGFEGEVTREELMGYAPSELNKLYDAFKEVNSHFFEVAHRLEMGRVIREMMVEITKSFTDSVVDS